MSVDSPSFAVPQWLRPTDSSSDDTVSLLDEIAANRAEDTVANAEKSLLYKKYWSQGVAIRLRDDSRFEQTPWGNWFVVDNTSVLINDWLYGHFLDGAFLHATINECLEAAGGEVEGRPRFCPADPRFRRDADEIRLSASGLSEDPNLVDDPGDGRYSTHLPFYSLKVIAASEPDGEWGTPAQEQLVDTYGWIRVEARKQLNTRMFVAQLEGHSMDDGRSGLVDGGYAIFELWPAGTKQLLNVLVRGAFNDPETGSYAVKKYVADQRGEDGFHQAISLVSLNQDKDRFPDINLRIEDEDDLAVVAKVVQPLTPDEYTRCPKPVKRKGWRDLDTQDGLQKVFSGLSERANRFFAPEVQQKNNDNEHPDTDAWNSQLVCLEADEGGLHLEIGPLAGLWKFVKVLVADATSGSATQTLASNARLRCVRVPVLPSNGVWNWHAKDFEDDPDVDISALDIDISQDSVSVFRVASDGVGRLVSNNTLSAGHSYRLIVPSKVWEEIDTSVISSVVLKDDWYLAELDLSAEPQNNVVDELEKMGLVVGEQSPSISLCLPTWPDQWNTTDRGDGYAVFATGKDGTTTLFVHVGGYDCEVDGEAQLFVHSGEEQQRLLLPAGNFTTVELSELSIGQYMCSMVHQRTRVQMAHLPFEIVAVSENPPDAALKISVFDETSIVKPGSFEVVWKGDLDEVSPNIFDIQGPPGWGVQVLWRELSEYYIGTMELSSTGVLDTFQLFELVRDRYQRSTLGDLVLKFSELGTVVIQHKQLATRGHLHQSLSQLVESKAEIVGKRAGAFTQLIPIWFDPVLRRLGYELDSFTEVKEDAPPVHAGSLGLLVSERGPNGEITQSCRRVLVMLEVVNSELGDDLLDWIDGMCFRYGVDSALLSNGLLFAEYRRRNRLPLEIWDIQSVLSNDEEFMGFLRVVAGEVQ